MRGSWLKIYTIMKRQLPKMKYILKINLKNKQGILLILILFPILSFTQTEFTTWGNITGIRVDNQLMEFNTSLIIIVGHPPKIVMGHSESPCFVRFLGCLQIGKLF